LKLFLLAFFDIPLDGFRAKVAAFPQSSVASRTNVISRCPQGSTLAPILATQAFRFLFQSAECYPLEQANNLSGSKRGTAF